MFIHVILSLDFPVVCLFLLSVNLQTTSHALSWPDRGLLYACWAVGGCEISWVYL